MNGKLRRFLHTFFKIFIVFLVVTAVINIGLLAFIIINHKTKSDDDKGFLIPPGQMVEVDGYRIHVLVTGNEESEDTLVFLHSSKIEDDSIALAPLFKELADYRLVYVDRSGFGFSDISGTERDIDTITEETRKALEACGIDGEYTVVAIGTSGIQAIHWANTYPDEVKNIIGLNMNYPAQFENMTTEEYCGFFDYLMVKFYSIGGQRLMKSLYPENKYGIYTDAQMSVRDALTGMKGYTEDMYNEDLHMVENAKLVNAEGIRKELPMTLIYANPIMEPYVNEDESVHETYITQKEKNPDVDFEGLYNEEIKEYFKEYENVEVIEMSGPARLYTYNPKGLAELIKN